MGKVFYKNISDNKNTDMDLSVFPDSLKSHIKRKDSYYAWLFLKDIIKEYYRLDIKDLSFTFNEMGKPLCEHFYFNISHSKDYVAVGISDKPIGVDIQYVDLKKDYSALARKLNVKSTDNIDIIRRFSVLEAYYKQKGGSIASSLKNNESEIKNTNKIIDNNYILAVVCDDDITITQISD